MYSIPLVIKDAGGMELPKETWLWHECPRSELAVSCTTICVLCVCGVKTKSTSFGPLERQAQEKTKHIIFAVI